jgi:hypothetical protein
MSEEHESANWFNVRFGSNLHKNSVNIIRIKGKDLIKLERGRDNKLLVSVEIRGKNGEPLAKIRRNAPVYLNKFLTIQRGLNHLKLSSFPFAWNKFFNGLFNCVNISLTFKN